MGVDPSVERAKLVVGRLQSQSGAELRLSPGTLEENDKVAGDGERHRTAEVLFHERQRQIDPRRHSSRSPDRTVAYEDRIGLNADSGKTLREPAAVLPVGRRAPSIEHAGRREQKGS